MFYILRPYISLHVYTSLFLWDGLAFCAVHIRWLLDNCVDLQLFSCELSLIFRCVFLVWNMPSYSAMQSQYVVTASLTSIISYSANEWANERTNKRASELKTDDGGTDVTMTKQRCNKLAVLYLGCIAINLSKQSTSVHQYQDRPCYRICTRNEWTSLEIINIIFRVEPPLAGCCPRRS